MLILNFEWLILLKLQQSLGFEVMWLRHNSSRGLIVVCFNYLSCKEYCCDHDLYKKKYRATLNKMAPILGLKWNAYQGECLKHALPAAQPWPTAPRTLE